MTNIVRCKSKKMKEKEVKEQIGKENWKDFVKFMRGQTVGINKDGSEEYYDYDVHRFQAGELY